MAAVARLPASDNDNKGPTKALKPLGGVASTTPLEAQK